ncbi:MAG: hypothetical protein JNL51_15340 [Chitinophagaceae bacterium]|nr:hypothetical protein [Chitinophagaceae bacterium]
MKLHFLSAAFLLLFLSCSKSSGDDADTCEDLNTTKVTFSNTTSGAMKVVLSATITPQYEPISPIFSIDLAPGQKVVKEFNAGRYIATWYEGCPSACNRIGNLFRDFNQCGEYEEKQ